MRVFSVFDHLVLGEFFANSSNMTAGMFVATGDVDGDGHLDIITGAGVGVESRVRVFSGTNLNGPPIRDFVAYPGFNVGVTVAAGDFDGDGKADIVTGPEAGNPHVKVFNGLNPAAPLLRSFFAFNPIYPVGASVAVGDMDGEGKPDIVAGAGAPGGPHVRAFSGINGSILREFFAFDWTFTGGVRVAAFDSFSFSDRFSIVAAPGPTNLNPSGELNKVLVFDPFGDLSRDFEPFGSFLGGAYVG